MYLVLEDDVLDFASSGPHTYYLLAVGVQISSRHPAILLGVLEIEVVCDNGWWVAAQPRCQVRAVGATVVVGHKAVAGPQQEPNNKKVASGDNSARIIGNAAV